MVCVVSYYLINHTILANCIQRTGHLILPFVLIGLNLYNGRRIYKIIIFDKK
jgi:hypothetical protein